MKRCETSEPQTYGRSPMLDALPLIRAEQAKDALDLLAFGDPWVRARFFARKRLAWRVMGLVE